jgi:MFS family permease
VADEAPLDWERRWARPAAAAAFLAAVLQIVSQALGAAALRDRPSGDRGSLIALDERTTEFLASTVARVLTVFFIVATLLFLFHCIRHRRELPPYVVGLLAAAPVLLAVATTWTQLQLLDIANEFTDSGPRKETRADDLLDDRSPVPSGFGLGGQLAIAFAYILISLNAMRAGLLSRFMGILGMIVGVLYVLPIFGGPLVVEIFWLGAVGLLFLGYWPGGRGPAWETGEEIPWPTAAARAGGGQPEPAVDPEPEQPVQRPASRKRRRKKRR